ncbi:ATP-binding protein [Pseudonocardia sp. TRM90224]|uniref:ATP-binding protein n=1 Tax=Pseudonocardia sp. TRM90224 TaxID=2812678 RepID=UPI001E355E45|nr:biotin carboxylase N-terminal domain-containing protein [Pseudonocardia sp. TRM90224]
MTMFRTLLVANRGEIACRVFRTASAMGIRTVAVYSDPDAGSPHVRAADRAVALGGSTAAQTYLDAEKILDAARRTGADAIHPGYGFLSENAAFAQACADAGIVFVGPSPESIRDMGRKDRAKDIARAAGVPVLPDTHLTDGAHGIPYPLLVKAVAGGGGRGMRLVEREEDLADAVAAARREAGSSFGDEAVFVERYLASARHVEVQVFGDSHGGAVHLGERECSVQRRHQKVLEESPSPAVSPQLRAAMGETSVALVRKLGYVGAGTIEYLLDDTTDEFFFLEMNTRLQVEHPVTEEVTGLDLVRLQLRVAAGERLDMETIEPRGHAIEVRLYAEDPAREYLPTPGPLFAYDHPDRPGVRYDDGVVAPGEIPVFYDPMLAKVIAHAPTRVEAAAALAGALEATRLHGTVTNRDLLVAVLRDPDFLAGETHTDFLDRHPALLDPPPATPRAVHLAAAVAVTAARRRATDVVPPGFRLLPGSPLSTARWSGHEVAYRLSAWAGEATLDLDIDGVHHDLVLHDLGPDGVRVGYESVEYPCAVTVHPDGSVWVNDPAAQSGWLPEPRLPDPELSTDAAGPVAEVPGTVVAVHVQPGDTVTAGQKLVVLEAMKMEHPTVAAADATVEAVHVEVGQYVDAHTVLVTLAAE